MKRIIGVFLLLYALFDMSLQANANETTASDVLYFFNPETLHVSVYTTAETYLNHSQTDFYILNGFPINAVFVNYHDDYAQINIYGQDIFCSKKYITNVCPITDLIGFSRLLNTDTSFHTINPYDTLLLKAFKDEVSIFGYINFQYFCKYKQQYGFIDLVDDGIFTIVSYDFEKQPLNNMMPVYKIREIATIEALQYLNISSLDNYHMDINIYTNTENPLGSMYVVHVYPQYPDRDVLQIVIDCMTGKIYHCLYSKQVFGKNQMQKGRFSVLTMVQKKC